MRAGATLVAHTGDGALWIAIGPGLLLIDQPVLALLEEVTVLALIIVVAALKFAVRRRRPTGQRGTLYLELDAHSFPSGHAARAAGLAVALGALIPQWAVGLGIWAALVSLARVGLGIHYVLDVLAGAFVGVLVGVAVVAVL